MNSFGNKNNFCIEYQTYPEMYPDNKNIQENIESYKTYGSMYFWVNGKNLFLFKGLGQEATYTADICTLVEIFSEKLVCYLKNDAFPAKTKATTGATMMDEMILVEKPDDDIKKYLKVDWDKVDKELYLAIDSWNYDHGILTHSDESFMPNIFFRRVNDKIEVSWNNDFSYDIPEGELFFEYKEGVEYLDIQVFKEVVVAFCLDFIKLYENKYPQAANRDRDNLQKAIDFEV